MQTLEQLHSGKLAGSKSVKLSCGLKEFPIDLFKLSETLELLDLSGNQLTALPEDFNKFSKLKIAFFSDNLFTEYPEILSQCPLLEMVGFKSNHISYISEKAISANIRWLILTNNQITYLPKSIGNCSRLQKVALAGNGIKELPQEMSNCKNLELLRISANQIQELPNWLMTLPKLSWLAFSDNPCHTIQEAKQSLNSISWNELELKEKLGEGASGIISKADWKNNKTVAVKIFKGDVTSDGLPISEMNSCTVAGAHKSLVTLLGKLCNHPQKKEGLIFDLIPSQFKNLGNPPNFITCTRDTYKEDTIFTFKQLIKISREAALVLANLHNKGIMHGDFYAHNIMIDEEANILLGDFGAATTYNVLMPNAILHQKLDVRAYGCLLEDILERIDKNLNGTEIVKAFTILKNDCMNATIELRPTFVSIHNKIVMITEEYGNK